MRQRTERRFTRAQQTYDREAYAQQEICLRMAEWLAPYVRERDRFTSALEIGCGTGGFTKYLLSLLPCTCWTLNDLCEVNAQETLRLYGGKECKLCVGDAEEIEWKGRYQLIASASTVQWFRRPWLWGKQMADLQDSGDLLCFTSFLPGTLTEIRTLTGKGLDYPTEEDWLGWLGNSYHPLFTRSEQICLYFESPLAVLRHLKETGVTATGGEFWTRSRLATFERMYRERYQTEDGKVSLTYLPVYFLLEKK